ncbi:MAG TPA: glycosyltransferase WbuB [Gallionella sp.]|nr:glycosyltransferase WbuB [Gallionella sp.]
MRILIHGLNFFPELTGIGKYTGEMAEWLATQGHEVRVVTAPPYYPQWRRAKGYANRWNQEEITHLQPSLKKDEGLLVVYRCPLWVPANPSGLKRILHLASFALSSFPIMISQLFWRPDVVMVIEPPLMCAPVSLLVSRLAGAKAWLHIQDFEVDAAFGLGILKSDRLRKVVLHIERRLMRSFDRVSTISHKMLEKLIEKGVESKKAVFFPNWADVSTIFPLEHGSLLRKELCIPDDKMVALYSGNMGEKQGLEIVLEAASRLVVNPNIQFVLCGDGAAKVKLFVKYEKLPNVVWLPLQPLERLNDLLNMADIHLLPQRADVADLVMPSKLTGMLASGRPVLATAHAGTQVAQVVGSCGKVVEPGDVQGFVQGLLELLHSPQQRTILGAAARQAATELDKSIVLGRFESQLLACLSSSQPQ